MSVAGPICFHCGEPTAGPVTVHARIGGVERTFCCHGCEAAAAWIESAGLGDYYRTRAQPAAVPEPVADAALEAWDTPVFLAAHAPVREGRRRITLVVEGVRCAACAWLIQRALAREPGVASVTINAATSRLSLEWDPSVTALSKLVALLARLGYRAHRPARDDARAVEGERRRSLKRLAVAALGAMQAMMFSEALYFGAGELDVATRDFFRWMTFLVSTPVVFYAGWPFLAGAWRHLRLRSAGMDLLVATSVLLAWGASVVETLRGGEAVYFDAAAMFVCLLLVARHVEAEARRRATAALDVLARAQPELATRLDAEGREATVAIAEIAPGDRLRVRAGDAVPVDGELLEAPAEVDESFITGEPRPVLRMPGEPVLAGSLVQGSAVTLRAIRRAGESTVARLAELAARAQAMRPRAACAMDRIAGGFVAVMLAAAAAIALTWLWFDPRLALPATLAVLAATCPCALALAAPAAIAAAQGALARLGALVLHPDAVETLARVDTVVFDKTGTLTVGRPQLSGVTVYRGPREEALAVAAALERGICHPLAAAFRAHDDGRAVSRLRLVAGHGIEGVVGGRAWRIGTRAFATGKPGDDDGTWLGDGEHAIARFNCVDLPRSGAEEVVAALQRAGLSVELLSGDAPARVRALARVLGIARWRPRCTPEAKLARIEALRRAGHCVAMVGDGVNDAAVLAGADVAIALADGAALAQASAGIVIAGRDLGRLPRLFTVARRARRVMRQNFAWAIAYNALVLPPAALALVPPWLAAVGMAASSLVVTLNALRLARAPAAARADAPAESRALREATA